MCHSAGGGDWIGKGRTRSRAEARRRRGRMEQARGSKLRGSAPRAGSHVGEAFTWEAGGRMDRAEAGGRKGYPILVQRKRSKQVGQSFRQLRLRLGDVRE
jgi:hypothetical protein